MEWENIPDDIEEYVGFVYTITNNINHKYYIGQKKFWSKVTLPPLKGKSRKRHKVKESDWKKYYGSSNELLEDIKKYGKENFTRSISKNLKSKSKMNYEETWQQFKNSVLFDKMSYNRIINCRINCNQLGVKK